MAITKATASSIAPAAKGDLVVGSATNDAAVLGVGSNDQVLTADSSTATGLKWATASAGGMTLISTTTLTGSSVTLSSIPATYKNLQIQVRNFRPASSTFMKGRFNSDSGTNYFSTVNQSFYTENNFSFNQDFWAFDQGQATTTNANNNFHIFNIYDYANTSTYKIMDAFWYKRNSSNDSNRGGVVLSWWGSTSAISSIEFFPNSGNFTSGTVLLYGVS